MKERERESSEDDLLVSLERTSLDMNTNTNTNTATDKSQLLAALAQQLRTEKEQGELAAREMVQLEHIVSDSLCLEKGSRH